MNQSRPRKLCHDGDGGGDGLGAAGSGDGDATSSLRVDRT
jgi:hypothetical protein